MQRSGTEAIRNQPQPSKPKREASSLFLHIVLVDLSVFVMMHYANRTLIHSCTKGYVCSTVSSILTGLETRSLGLNTLGTASSQSVQVGRLYNASSV